MSDFDRINWMAATTPRGGALSFDRWPAIGLTKELAEAIERPGPLSPDEQKLVLTALLDCIWEISRLKIAAGEEEGLPSVS